ncbi:MAG TPA: hypothetical protein VM509_08200, partial [Planctomycetota bacterium]|nr:hypothetical protein [Planctomycetota bacterium]
PSGASVALEPPTMPVAEPLTTRRAELPSGLAAELARGGEPVLVDVRAPDGTVLARLALEAPSAPEFSVPPALLPGLAETRSAAPSPRSAAHPAAPWVLLTAVGLLAVAVLRGLAAR